MKWICRWFGHKFGEFDVLVFQIEFHAGLHPILICRRCHTEWR